MSHCPPFKVTGADYDTAFRKEPRGQTKLRGSWDEISQVKSKVQGQLHLRKRARRRDGEGRWTKQHRLGTTIRKQGRVTDFSWMGMLA